MRLGVNVGYWGMMPVDPVALTLEAERLGFHSVWTAEAYGSDALTPLVWLAAKTERINVGTAIMQIPARQPTATAMAAGTLDILSGGRMLLGIGASGPQVSEGWYGQAYGSPLAKTREYVAIVRQALRRDAPLEFHGEYYDIPLQGGTGLGKPLKLILKPRPDIPVYLAAIGPKNVALAAEIADGWLPVFTSPHRFDVFKDALSEGFERGDRDPAAFDIAPTVYVVLGDDVAACRDILKPVVALYVGGMGARNRNFYNNLARRMGYEDAARTIQDLYLAGKKAEATAAVPDELVDEVSLCGPAERIRERLEPWREAGITTLIAGSAQPEALRVLAEAVL